MLAANGIISFCFFFYGRAVFLCDCVPYLLYAWMSMLTFDDSVLAVAHWFPQLTSTSMLAVWSVDICWWWWCCCASRKGEPPGRAPLPPCPQRSWTPLSSHQPTQALCSLPLNVHPTLLSPAPTPWPLVLCSPWILFQEVSWSDLQVVSHPVPTSTWMHTQDRHRQAFLIAAGGHCPGLRGHTLSCMCHSLWTLQGGITWGQEGIGGRTWMPHQSAWLALYSSYATGSNHESQGAWREETAVSRGRCLLHNMGFCVCVCECVHLCGRLGAVLQITETAGRELFLAITWWLEIENWCL